MLSNPLAKVKVRLHKLFSDNFMLQVINPDDDHSHSHGEHDEEMNDEENEEMDDEEEEPDDVY